ncbi:esterase/lipase family protein [Nocardioides sp. SYSU DS0651]|uniref:esterase/lipase family protein n=1 Tax=Nocardioides sp. SYSU DS0651 TaxID=3415955 RepID=UPI003F4B7F53
MRTPRALLAALLTSLLLALAVHVAPAAEADTIWPPLPTAPEGDIPGVNVWSCKPSAARPTPVIIVHGTIGDRRHLLERLGKTIKAKGFCVYALDYGNRGLNDVARSAEQLKAFVARVRRATGAAKVSMVGHSQGGMMPRYYIKFLGGGRHVDDLVGLAPSNHGTKLVPADNPLAALLPGLICLSCQQQAWGSPFLARLNAGDETPGPVSYTQITSRYDEVVVPHTSGHLTPGPRTTNVTVQDKCPLSLAEHLLLPSDTGAIAITLDALTRPGPARPSFQPRC